MASTRTAAIWAALRHVDAFDAGLSDHDHDIDLAGREPGHTAQPSLNITETQPSIAVQRFKQLLGRKVASGSAGSLWGLTPTPYGLPTAQARRTRCTAEKVQNAWRGRQFLGCSVQRFHSGAGEVVHAPIGAGV